MKSGAVKPSLGLDGGIPLLSALTGDRDAKGHSTNPSVHKISVKINQRRVIFLTYYSKSFIISIAKK